MKKSRFTESQIVKAIREHENGRNVNELFRELGISWFVRRSRER
jgi:putative transposase